MASTSLRAFEPESFAAGSPIVWWLGPMNERATAPKPPEGAQLSGAEPTLAAGTAAPGDADATTPHQAGAPHAAAEATPAAAQAASAPTQSAVGATSAKAHDAQAGAHASDLVSDWTGKEVAGRYRILERIGEGGMGVVYVAEHLSLQKKVAFKVIHPQLAKHEDLLLRFQREALATGQLDHPHITAAIDFGELEGGGAFMVMPWVRGRTLQAELDDKGRMEYRRAAEICGQIADALSAAHTMGIVHRDLKPDNVLLETRSDGSESAKVLDFGVASLAGRPEGLSVDARPLTQAGTILGTPGYMSPEQASAGDVDHRTDIYALGVILWELCRGERLFSGDDITKIFAKQFKSVPAPLELGLSSPARELSQLVARMLSWDKSSRPSTAAEVRDTLRRIAAMPDTRLPTLRIPVSRFPEALQKVPLPQPLEPYRGYLPHAVLVALTVLVLSFWKGDEPKPEATQEPTAQVEGRESARTKGQKEAAPPREKARSEAEDTETEPPARAAPEEPRKEPAARRARARDDMQEALDNLLNSRASSSRRTAARFLIKHPNTPHYIALMADLELNTRCAGKRDIIAQMAELADPRVLPALERLSETPRRGCGLIRLADCYGCLRHELDQTMTALREAQAK